MPVVVVTGARQSGKSTLVLHTDASSRRYETLDDFDTLAVTQEDALALFGTNELFTVDEVQRNPRSLLAIKQIVDKERSNGRFLLTGSANLLLMEKVADSLAGRASYLTLWPMTLREQLGFGRCGVWSEICDGNDSDWIEILNESADASFDPKVPQDWREWVKRGGYPTPVLEKESFEERAIWYRGYIQTYLERDLSQLSNISSLPDFRRLITIASQRIGQTVNQSELSRVTGISQPTINRYLNLLEVSYQIVRVPAYSVNRTKRLIKSPKLYWSDTGLANYLSGTEPNGFLFENLILNDMLVWRDSSLRQSGMFHWRTTTGSEVDFVLETSAGLLPIEVKTTQNPRQRDTTGLRAFAEEYASDSRSGLLIHAGTETKWLNRDVLAVPWQRILLPELASEP